MNKFKIESVENTDVIYIRNETNKIDYIVFGVTDEIWITIHDMVYLIPDECIVLPTNIAGLIRSMNLPILKTSGKYIEDKPTLETWGDL